MSSPSVSIVIVNFNGERFLAPCLSSVLAQTRPFDEIILVDNASSDASLELVHHRFPQVRVIKIEKNVGYAQGCNVGIRASSGDLVAVLNNDAVLDSHWLERLLEYNQEPWSFWASLIVFASTPGKIDSAGDAMSVVGAGFKIGHMKKAEDRTEPKEVFGPCAAAALYRRSLLDATGGFDPDFFLIYEDADLNFRARLLGFRCLFVPGAIAYHHVNSSIGSYSHTYVFFGHRNSEYVYWKNMPLALLLLYLPERMLFDLASFLFFSLKGRPGSFLRAKLDFLRNFPAVLKKRRAVQKSRVLTTGEVRRILVRNYSRYRLKTIGP
ncbi:MAG TPA: glycosyltransferase family 2 protein [Acidobacteriota bacterium]|nr:glycosyltransferase family 2 protein [Acidobacteriota bacterium]